jgi:Mn2+/Fe2+ NRAMP family transporter
MELGLFVNGVADWFGESNVISTLFDNPIYVAMVMTLIIVIIFYLSRDSDSFSRPAIKTLIVLVVIMFIYHRRFEKRHEKDMRAASIANALQTPSSVDSPGNVPVVPQIYVSSSTQPLQPLQPLVASTQ